MLMRETKLSRDVVKSRLSSCPWQGVERSSGQSEYLIHFPVVDASSLHLDLDLDTTSEQYTAFPVTACISFCLRSRIASLLPLLHSLLAASRALLQHVAS